MRTHAADPRPHLTRRSFLAAIGLAFAARFTAITDELARLFRCCSLDAPPGAATA